MRELTDTEKLKARRALERRFGQSVLPYRYVRHPGVRTVVRCTDLESGSWIDVDLSGRRARVLLEMEGDR